MSTNFTPATDGIAQSLRSIQKSSFENDEARARAVDEARALVSRLESSWETAFRLSWTHTTIMACISTAMKLEVFDKWVQHGGAPKSGEALAQLVGCDGTLLSNTSAIPILLHLVAGNILAKDENKLFNLTSYSSALAGPQLGSTVEYYSDVQAPALLNLPNFLAKTHFSNPSDPDHGNFNNATGQAVYEYFKAHPQIGANFNTVMETFASYRQNWVDIYPGERLLSGGRPGRTVLVDVGGSVGHDIENFRRRFPQSADRLVLQDRPEVLDQAASLDEAIIKMPHDFFTPQPVKGAAAYFSHSILHNWPDNEARRLLEALKPAMERGHSKLLIHEIVIGAHPTLFATTCDITMMGLTSATERTEQMWRDLLDSAGFKILKIWSLPLATESIIEAELK